MREETYETLIAEHQNLALKDAVGEITPAERRKLLLVRWQIDRIEEAIHGEDMDRLEALADVRKPITGI